MQNQPAPQQPNQPPRAVDIASVLKNQMQNISRLEQQNAELEMRVSQLLDQYHGFEKRLIDQQTFNRILLGALAAIGILVVISMVIE